MSKVIISPIARWAGTVTIADPLTLPQAELIQDGFERDEPVELIKARKDYFDCAKELGQEHEQTVKLRLALLELAERTRPFHTVADKRQLPAIFACVEKWELANMPEKLTIDNFPASPRGDSHRLIEWLFEEICKVFNGEKEIPNE
jgi:hypothetical protein